MVTEDVNFKTYSKSNKLKRRLKNSPNNMLVFENTHEAIVSRKVFEMVQRHFEGRKRPDKQGEMDKYAGYLYCGECGSKLYLHRAYSMSREQNNFMCGGYQSRKTSCTSHYIRETVLDQIVLQSIRDMTAFARENPEAFYRKATQNGEVQAKRFYASAKKEVTQIESRIKELDNIIRCLYEDRVTGRITPERYDQMAGGYEQEQAERKTQLHNLNEKLAEMDMRETYIREFMDKAKEHVEMKTLTPELLKIFIRRIEVFEKEVKYSRTEGNHIDIYFTFHAPQRYPQDALVFAS